MFISTMTISLYENVAKKSYTFILYDGLIYCQGMVRRSILRDERYAMNSMLTFIMEHIPYVEIAARFYTARHETIKKGIKKSLHSPQTESENSMTLSGFRQALEIIGVGEGDIILVHSSMHRLRKLKASPAEIINALIETVGKSGTVVFPVFPKYTDKDRVEIDGDIYLRYQRGKTPCWTGILPFVFYRRPDTVVSSYPYNTLAAVGAKANEMMQHNITSDLAHGEGSAWYYCVQNHAKVLYLGLRVIDADTLLHVAEDIMDTTWPIKNWYTKQNYILDTGSDHIPITIRVRDGAWHKYFASYYSGRILSKAQLIREKKIDGIRFGIIDDADQFVNFVIQRAQQGKTFYFIPRRKRYRKT